MMVPKSLLGPSKHGSAPHEGNLHPSGSVISGTAATDWGSTLPWFHFGLTDVASTSCGQANFLGGDCSKHEVIGVLEGKAKGKPSC